MKAQSARIAQILNQDYGTATITHPFHPLHGKTFTVLKIRKYPHERFVSLLAEDDVFCVPESWIMPQADNTHYSPFDIETLRSLLELSRIYTENVDKDVAL
jgi:L-lactate utilization protein LutC